MPRHDLFYKLCGRMFKGASAQAKEGFNTAYRSVPACSSCLTLPLHAPLHYFSLCSFSTFRASEWLIVLCVAPVSVCRVCRLACSPSTDPLDLFTSIARDPAPIPDGVSDRKTFSVTGEDGAKRGHVSCCTGLSSRLPPPARPIASTQSVLLS